MSIFKVSSFKLFALLSVFRSGAAHYTLSDDYSGVNFLSNFTYFTGADPTNGHVQFLDQTTAMNNNLIGVIPSQNNSVYIGVDHTSLATHGRQALRLSSAKSYNHGLFLADINHMPGGICGVWPAFWLLGGGIWPAGGEVDIVEGVNDQQKNFMTLHTSANCAVSGTTFSGNLTTKDCDTNAPDQDKNAGCGIDSRDTNSFGDGFNAIDGGVYATEWNSSVISVWYFPRTSIPSDIEAQTPDPTGWGVPVAQFGGACDIDSHFKEMNIIFDTTFCGDWAGRTWNQSSTCMAKAATCEDYVTNNPGDFAEAYWGVNSVRVYEE